MVHGNHETAYNHETTSIDKQISHEHKKGRKPRTWSFVQHLFLEKYQQCLKINYNEAYNQLGEELRQTMEKKKVLSNQQYHQA